ncbi:MAG: exodeoxyribonuclease III [Opitutales bacterium]
MRLVSWNINGLRSIARQEVFGEFLKQTAPDIVCLQETKIDPDTARTVDLGTREPVELLFPHQYWHLGTRLGYSGTAVLTREAPLRVDYDLPTPRVRSHQPDPTHPPEGRLIAAEFPTFYLLNVYVPNSGRGLPRLSYRQNDWDPALVAACKRFGRVKPVVICGDFNVAHEPIDLANPKQNKRNAGFTEEERAGFSKLLKSAGLVDSFRHFYPDTEGAYSWWTYRGDVRERNIGWRIDYFLVSKKLIPKLKDARIHPKVFGSDHCPVSIDLKG